MKHTKFALMILLLAAVALAIGAGTPRTPAAAAAAGTPAPPLATAMGAGTVFLNGRLAPGPSLMLASGDRLETGPRGGVVVSLPGQDGLVLGENSALAIAARSDGIAAELEHGRVLVNSSSGRLRELRLAGDNIAVRAAAGDGRRFEVIRLKNQTYVVARAGSVTIFDESYAAHTDLAEGRAALVRPEAEMLVPPQRAPATGQKAPAGAQKAAPPAPASSGQRAGEISAAIPRDYIVRAGQTLEGNRGDIVVWNDLLRTEPRGRVRLALDDGSILNVGSGSELRVEQHDNRTQQTSLLMNYGRVRAQVVKLAQPNAKFEVRTKTVVCGVLGTDFYVEADDNKTTVVVFRGLVRVTPLLAGAAAGISVGAGQTTTATGSAASAPTTATAGQIQSALNASQVGAAGTVAQSARAATTASRITLLTTIPGIAVAGAVVPGFVENQASPFRR